MMARVFTWEFAKRAMLVTLGCILGAVGVQVFLVPIHLLTAGVAGLAVLVSYVSPLPVGVVLFTLNVPIFLICRRYLDRDFLLWSLVGMLGLSAAFALTAPLSTLHPVEDPYLNLIAGGVIAGLGTGLVLRSRASQGGTDVIAAAVRKVNSIRIGTLLFALNASVVVVLAAIYGLEPALSTILVIAIESVVADKTITGIDANKVLMTTTAKPTEVSKTLMEKLDRGVTILNGTGAYTGEPRPVLMCILRTRQLAVAIKAVKDVDPEAFTYVQDVTEVFGHGFKAPPI